MAEIGISENAESVLAAQRTLRRARLSPVPPRRLDPLDRVERLCDSGSVYEPFPLRGSSQDGSAEHGNGVIAALGKVDGRPLMVISHDFAYRGGSIGTAFADTVVRAQRLAIDRRMPLVYLNDSGGARIHEGVAALDGCGRIFRQNVIARAIVPQISVILGPCAGAAAYSPALTDWTIMLCGGSQMFLTGPEVVRAATGEVVNPEDLGGASLHTHESGVAHLDADSEEDALMLVRRLLGFLPQSVGAALPTRPAVKPDSPVDLIARVVPPLPHKPFNMRRVLAGILDGGGDEIEIMPKYAPSILTGFARLQGLPVGIVASQPSRRGGILDARSATKAARFVSFCGRFAIPILTFIDVPGFLPGPTEERRGVITHGAELLAAYVEAPSPKLTVIVRKAYGGAYIAMGSQSLGADFCWAWPGAEVAVMGPEAAVGILHRRELNAAEDPAKRRAELAADYRSRVTPARNAAERGILDDVIQPSETRERLVQSLSLLLPEVVAGPATLPSIQSLVA